jgi:hypothetical protein
MAKTKSRKAAKGSTKKKPRKSAKKRKMALLACRKDGKFAKCSTPGATRPKKAKAKRKSKRRSTGAKKMTAAKRKASKRRARYKTGPMKGKFKPESRRRKGERRKNNPISHEELAFALGHTPGAPSGTSTALARASNPTPMFGVPERADNPVMTAGQIAMAVGALGVSYTLTDLLDRVIATNSAKGCSKEAKLGVSALKIQQRPGLYRLGVQVVLAAAGYAGAYFVGPQHGMAQAALGGLGAGAGVHALVALLNSRVMPAIFKADNADSDSLGNRLYPAEQAYVQDKIDAAMTKIDEACSKQSAVTQFLSIDRTNALQMIGYLSA